MPKFVSFDKKELFYRAFTEVKEPKAVLLLIHGMSEHSGRYKNFAKFMNQNDIIVYAPDLRIHGLTAESVARIGRVEENNFENSVNDILELTNFLKEKYPTLPLFEFGHSFGSMLTQEYIIEKPSIKGSIICGTSYMNTPLNKMAYLIAKITAKYKGKDADANLIKKLSFDAYKKKFEDKSWLSQDPLVEQVYNQDEFCNKIFSAGFYVNFMKNAIKLSTTEKIAAIDEKMPIFLIAGAKDPVGSFGKGVKKLYKKYKKAKKNVAIKLYKNGRHEILNETFKEEVYNDIKDFVLKNI